MNTIDLLNHKRRFEERNGLKSTVSEHFPRSGGFSRGGAGDQPGGESHRRSHLPRKKARGIDGDAKGLPAQNTRLLPHAESLPKQNTRLLPGHVGDEDPWYKEQRKAHKIISDLLDDSGGFDLGSWPVTSEIMDVQTDIEVVTTTAEIDAVILGLKGADAKAWATKNLKGKTDAETKMNVGRFMRYTKGTKAVADYKRHQLDEAKKMANAGSFPRDSTGAHFDTNKIAAVFGLAADEVRDTFSAEGPVNDNDVYDLLKILITA